MGIQPSERVMTSLEAAVWHLHRGNVLEGMQKYTEARTFAGAYRAEDIQNAVYRKMAEIKGFTGNNAIERGKQCLYGLNGYTSSSEEKAQAIGASLPDRISMVDTSRTSDSSMWTAISPALPILGTAAAIGVFAFATLGGKTLPPEQTAQLLKFV